MKPKGFALKKVALQMLILAVLAGVGVSFAGPGRPTDPDPGFSYNPLAGPLLKID